jgi:hypothetical protein
VGRPISNSKKPGPNNDDFPCKLRRAREVIENFKGAVFMAVCDFKRAYWQVHYEMVAWGYITYVYENRIFINTRITFGIRHGGGMFVTISRACSQLFALKVGKE